MAANLMKLVEAVEEAYESAPESSAEEIENLAISLLPYDLSEFERGLIAGLVMAAFKDGKLRN